VTKRPVLLVATMMAGILLLGGCGGATKATQDAGAGPAASPAAPATSAAHSDHSSVVPAASKLRKGERFLELSMPRPYTPAPPQHGTDDYRCFIVDPHLTKTTFLTGSQFLPNNPAIVHHAIFFKLDRKDIGLAQEQDAKSPGDGWTCFTGTGIGPQAAQLRGAPWLAAWAPGGGESLAAPGTGFEMEPGSQVIMQVHYNLLATGGKATGSDQSGIRLRLAPASSHLNPLHTTLLIAPIELPCAAGETGKLCDRDLSVFDVIRRFGQEAGYTVAGMNFLCNDAKAPKPGNTQHCDRKARTDMVVYAVAGHMHLLGKSIKVELNPGTTKAKTLLDVPTYNFDDQGARRLATPVTVKAGDDLRVTCTHDATLRSKLPALKTLPPRYVVWGEGTSDEMCLGVVIWADKAAAAA
jgi:hypothetical protein